MAVHVFGTETQVSSSLQYMVQTFPAGNAVGGTICSRFLNAGDSQILLQAGQQRVLHGKYAFI